MSEDRYLKQGRFLHLSYSAEEIQGAGVRGFSATADTPRLVEMDAIIICVPTPLNEYHEPDLSYITSTAHSIAPYLKPGHLVITETRRIRVRQRKSCCRSLRPYTPAFAADSLRARAQSGPPKFTLRRG